MANNFFKVNKGIGLVPQTSDPSPANNGDIYYNSTLGKFRKYENGSWSDLGSGSGNSGIITNDDSNFEASIGNWVTYADAAGTQPVDGTGGSPNVTFTRITSGQLNGTASARLTKDAANRQGQGASLTQSVPLYLRGLPSKIQFSLNASAGFDFGTAFDSSDPADVTVYLYDVTNSKLLQPYPYSLISNGIFEGFVQIPSDCTSIRLILHVTTTNATAWTLDIDDVTLSATLNSDINADSDWEDMGALTFNATTTNPTKGGTRPVDKFWGRKDGSDLVARVEYHQTSAGTAGSGDYLLVLPNNLKIDLTKLNANGATNPLIPINVVGNYDGSDGASIFPGGSVIVYDETRVKFRVTNAASTFNVGSGNLPFSNTTYSFGASFRVPIKGWTSGNATAASANLNAPATFLATKASGSVSANTTIPTWTTVKDSVNAFDSSTGIYTVKSPGDYFFSFSFQATTTTSARPTFRLNGSLYREGSYSGADGSGTVVALIPNLKVGDQVSTAMSAALTINDGAGLTDTVFQGYKVETSGRVYSTRTAYIKDVKANTTAPGALSVGSYAARTLNTLEGDTSFISLSSNQFTLQPGTYKIESESPGQVASTGTVIMKSKLRNITDSADTLIGSTCINSNPSAVGSVDTVRSFIRGVFSITSAKVFEIQMRASQAANGGSAASFGDNEVYTQVEIEKVL